MLIQGTADLLGQAAVVVVVTATGILNHFAGKRKDKRHTASLDTRFAELRSSMDQRFNAVDIELTTLRAHVIGPDGENGLRGDVREIKKRVIDLEDRERDHLHGPYDRRT